MLLAALALGVLGVEASAQSHRIRFDQLTIADGLSQGSGNAILQDSKGFLWIGTQDGLNRYDGYRVEVFKHDSEDPDSLADNFVFGLREDSQGRLWIFSRRPGALNSYDLKSGRFRRYVHDPDDPATLPASPVHPGVFYEADDGLLWLGTADAGIAQLDPVSGRVRRLQHDPDDASSLSDDRALTLTVDRGGTFWIGTRGGLNRLLSGGAGSPGGERFVRYLHDPEDPASLSHDDAWSVLEDSSGALWVGTQGGGLNRLAAGAREAGARFERFFDQPAEDETDLRFAFPVLEDGQGRVWTATGGGLLRYDVASGELRRYRHDPQDPHSIGGDNLRQILEDSTGALWIVLLGIGVSLYDEASDGFVTYTHDGADPHSLAGNFVNTLYEDRSGILWLGTEGSGVSRFSRQKHKFTFFQADPGDPTTLADNVIFAIYEDAAGTLWVGTQAGGLHRFDERRERVVERYFRQPGSRRDLGSNYVSSAFEDRQGRFWVGTRGAGLVLLDRGRGEVVRRFRHDPDDPTSLSGNGVSSIFQDRRGTLWIAANGWNRFDPEAGTFRRYQHDPEDPKTLPHNGVKLTREDRSGELWIATSGGLARFHRESETFTTYRRDLDDANSLGHDSVMGLYEDADGIFWITTYGGGLNRFDPESGRFTRFTMRDGLPNDSLYGVLPDDQGHLWLSSNHGLSRFDPAAGTFTNYDVEDGLQSNEFNDRAFYGSARGELYFGGVHGFNRFDPAEIQPSSYVPPVVLTAFRKFDREVELERTLAETQRVTVSYKENYFSFELAVLDYSRPSKNRYAYKLEGFDKDWVAAGTRRFASYTNLDGGDYTFRVRGANGDGVWNEAGASIEVRVIPPPWKTWWAYCTYLLLATGGVLGYVRIKTAAQQEELARERQEAARLRQIDRMKDEFLANTSHELRTPLNGIIGIAESLLDGATGRLPEATRANLSMVVTSGRRLSHLVDDILDFSKLKGHQIDLRTAPVGLRPLVEAVLSLSEPLAAAKQLALVDEVPEDLPAVAGDENRLQQILHNLIGNGIKFTESGEVRVGAVRRGELVEVAVADTGIGIAPEKLGRIFESFEQADGSSARAHGGTGLGLTITRQLVELHGGEIRAESEPGEGSRLIFTLPVWSGEVGSEPPAAPPSARQLARVRDPEPPPMTLPAAEPEPAAASAAVAGAAGKVLIVDDEPINLQVLRNVLTLAGFGITQAHDGHQCLKLLKEEEAPDLILLDVMMPGLTGFEVTQRIRNRFSANDLPILLVTAKNQVQDLEKGLASGANDYLTKPFSRGELLARMQTHLSLSRAHSFEAENRRKTEELEQARLIQLSLLPKAPPESPFLEIAAHMQTATEVGGDYYDFFPQDDGSLYVVAGDATGHGISAGMMVSMTKSALKALDVQSPHVLLTQLNRVIRAVHLERMQMALNVTHVTEREIAVASAAMPPALLYRGDGGVEEILLPGLPLGGLEDTDYPLTVKDFHRGDALLLISDGLPELAGADGELLGYEAVERCLATHGARPAAEILEALLELGRDWAGGEASADDVTIVVLRRV